MNPGKIYLIGAGPGDPELITLKGSKLISQADVILYDQLAPCELLKFAKTSCELISVGKFASQHTMTQEQINALLIERAKTNKIVVRLKGGDPYIFGRGGEEAVACVEAGIDFEVVPGVTSSLAAPSYAGIPPTHRDYTSNIAIVTGHRKKDDLEIEIPAAGTIIFLMGVANIEKIINSLLKAGWPNDSKIAAIERGTCYNQRVITGTLGNFISKIKEANVQPPAIFIVGKVVELHDKLNWYAKKPKILLLGTHPEKYKHLGTIVHRPIIDCVPMEDYSQLDAVLKNIINFDWIVFTSVNGVKFFYQRLFAAGLDARILNNTKIGVIGKTTAERIAQMGLLADLCPDNESSAGLLDKFKEIDLKNKKVLLPRAEIATDELSKGLEKAGAITEEIPVYKTVEIDPGEIDFDYIDQILFTSGSIIRAFAKKYGKVPPHVKVYCLGQPSLNEAKKYRIEAEVLKASE